MTILQLKNEENLNFVVDNMKRICKSFEKLMKICGIYVDIILHGNSIEIRWDKC